MKTLSIKQPWSWLIANQYKDIENRTWKTNYRGEFLIHAGKQPDKNCVDFISDALSKTGHVGALKSVLMRSYESGYGGIIGIAEIVDCVTESDSPWFTGQYGFVIKNARPLPFYPCRGKLSFFEVDYP